MNVLVMVESTVLPYSSSLQRRTVLLLAALAVTLCTLLALAVRGDEGLPSVSDTPKKGRNTFSVEFEDKVAMRVTKSAHYDLVDDVAAEEWVMLLPRNGHVVHVDDDTTGIPRAYTVTLFHQLKCLDVIREQYIGPPENPPSTLLHHCMNYLRQVIWCRPNLWLESAKSTAGTASRDYDAVCRDWTKVYDEADRNFEAYQGYRAIHLNRSETL